MNATKRFTARAGSVVCSVLAVALTGCQTHVVHERTRTVYVPTPSPVVQVPPVVAPAPQPPPTVVAVTPAGPAPVVVIQSEQDFYEPLTAHGRWVVVGSYGRCWIPARVESGWRPYANGYWQRTDAGWYWVSEEPWGWATYHYGRWDFHAQFGWIWVPHTQWAPAWVVWREGGGYVGWAPLRPSVTVGVNFGATDYEPAFASRAFVFVEHRRMLEPVRPRTVIVNNTTIINRTVNITNVKVVNQTVINEGPRPEVIERASGRKVRSVAVREFRHREETAVAARERSLPTARDRKVESPARPAPQASEQKSFPVSVTRPVDRPAQAVTQPPQPRVAPARPTPARPELDKPARDEKQPENETGRNVTTTRPAVAPKENLEVKPPQAVPPRPEVRPVARPVVTPPQQPVTTNPVRESVTRPSGRTPPATVTLRPEAGRAAQNDIKPNAAIETTTSTTPSKVAPRPRQEARPETRLETNRPVRIETAPAAATNRQTAPSAETPAGKRPISPSARSQAADGAGANKKVKEAEGPKQEGADRETPPAASTRPAQ